jgi:hypothetical protein
MDKYFAFRKMLDFMSEHARVVDADMNYYRDTSKITGEKDDLVIEIQISISKKEAQKDA